MTSDAEPERCCDRKVFTPFCPYCGSAVHRTPGAQLLAHCARQLETFRRKAEQNPKFNTAVKRWTEWVEFVRVAVEAERND